MSCLSDAWMTMGENKLNWFLISLTGSLALGCGFWGGFHHCYLKEKSGENPSVNDVLYPFTSGRTLDLLMGQIVANIGCIFTLAMWGFTTVLQVDQGSEQSQARQTSTQMTAGRYVDYLKFFFIKLLMPVANPIWGPAMSVAMAMEFYNEKSGGFQNNSLNATSQTGAPITHSPQPNQPLYPGQPPAMAPPAAMAQTIAEPMPQMPPAAAKNDPAASMPTIAEPMLQMPPAAAKYDPAASMPTIAEPMPQMPPAVAQANQKAPSPAISAPVPPQVMSGLEDTISQKIPTAINPTVSEPWSQQSPQPTPTAAPVPQEGTDAPTMALGAEEMQKLGIQLPGQPNAPVSPVAHNAPIVATAQPSLQQTGEKTPAVQTDANPDMFFEDKTQAMEIKTAVNNNDGTWTCGYCNVLLPEDNSATCHACGGVVIRS
jgi:hypothetical protein